MNNNIGIIYICTGKYRVFLDRYIDTCEEFFLKKSNKKYFIFCDQEVDSILSSKKISYQYIFQEKLPFPLPTLKRFHMINSIEEKYKDLDYLFFTNANMIFEKAILEEEIFPSDEDNGLCAVLHPGYYNSNNVNSFPYERNLMSSACIDYNFGKKYYQGCFFGGKKTAFLKMSRELQENIDYDLSNNFIAVWWDESHSNKYFAHTSPRALLPSYSYPEDWSLNLERKIVQLNKEKFGGHEEMRK